MLLSQDCLGLLVLVLDLVTDRLFKLFAFFNALLQRPQLVLQVIDLVLVHVDLLLLVVDPGLEQLVLLFVDQILKLTRLLNGNRGFLEPLLVVLLLHLFVGHSHAALNKVIIFNLKLVRNQVFNHNPVFFLLLLLLFDVPNPEVILFFFGPEFLFVF